MLALQPRESAGGDGARQSECERAHTPVCTTLNAPQRKPARKA